VPRFDDWAVQAKRSASAASDVAKTPSLRRPTFSITLAAMPARRSCRPTSASSQMWAAQRFSERAARISAPRPASVRCVRFSRQLSARASPIRPPGVCDLRATRLPDDDARARTRQRYQVPVKIVLIDTATRHGGQCKSCSTTSATRHEPLRQPDFARLPCLRHRVVPHQWSPRTRRATRGVLALQRSGVVARIVFPMELVWPMIRQGASLKILWSPRADFVNYDLVVGDSRTVARVINMAHRFQCRASRVIRIDRHRDDGALRIRR